MPTKAEVIGQVTKASAANIDATNSGAGRGDDKNYGQSNQESDGGPTKTTRQDSEATDNLQPG